MDEDHNGPVDPSSARSLKTRYEQVEVQRNLNRICICGPFDMPAKSRQGA
ncbi:uncharacterized protein FOMMEDRAFT_156432 [Fomitiporia mediterranea MF3/22]|nr:uncharacterized protein FOMMEDRAFT_156432 [Fomitiporia mediterranea MF3/22]EJD03064.1 hypothetical protein FOMMEDRAFT_156432 [Fomitiporia mediterranea MF3/22]